MKEINPANCPHGIAMDIYCEKCEEARIKSDGVGTYIKPLLDGSGNNSLLAKEIWNAAIEEAALKIKEQYDHFGDAVIMHYKPMWIDEIRKLKKQ